MNIMSFLWFLSCRVIFLFTTITFMLDRISYSTRACRWEKVMWPSFAQAQPLHTLAWTICIQLVTIIMLKERPSKSNRINKHSQSLKGKVSSLLRPWRSSIVSQSESIIVCFPLCGFFQLQVLTVEILHIYWACRTLLMWRMTDDGWVPLTVDHPFTPSPSSSTSPEIKKHMRRGWLEILKVRSPLCIFQSAGFSIIELLEKPTRGGNTWNHARHQAFCNISRSASGRYIFAYRWSSISGAFFSKYAVSFSALLNTIHIAKLSQIFYLLFSIAFSKKNPWLYAF